MYEARFPKSKTIQIYNPIDPLLFVEKHEYEDASKKIISVGRLRPQKNFSRLLDIAYETLKEYPEWQWDIYGEGPLREDLEKKRDSLGLREQVHFCGQVSDLYSRYHNYSFMVMTSDYEGFPMTLLEGAANGLPMLSFDIPTGPSEIIEDGKNGFLCDNIEQMQSAIKSLITDAERRCVMSVESRRTASHFGVEEVCNQWMSALNKTM